MASQLNKFCKTSDDTGDVIAKTKDNVSAFFFRVLLVNVILLIIYNHVLE